LNVYLTLFCRRLRPELQVVSRATYERNVATLYRAGADSVLSYATIGATDLWNHAGLSHRVLVAEGNELFLVTRPASLVRRSLRDDEVRRRTGCHIVAVLEEDGTLGYDTEAIPAAPGKLLLLGDRHAERRFRETYLRGHRLRRRRPRRYAGSAPPPPPRPRRTTSSAPVKRAAGAPAPALALPPAGGGRVSLAELRGAPALIWFYPAANASLCTK